MKKCTLWKNIRKTKCNDSKSTTILIYSTPSRNRNETWNKQVQTEIVWTTSVDSEIETFNWMKTGKARQMEKEMDKFKLVFLHSVFLSSVSESHTILAHTLNHIALLTYFIDFKITKTTIFFLIPSKPIAINILLFKWFSCFCLQ